MYASELIQSIAQHNNNNNKFFDTKLLFTELKISHLDGVTHSG